jgi:hypothetical protein
MDIDAIKAEISLLLNQMENQPGDAHELYEMIREKLGEMRAFGLPLPDDLLELEKKLERDFTARIGDESEE